MVVLSRRGPLIALEGLDGTGKSRLSEALAARMGLELRRTPAPQYDALRAALHGRGAASLFMYLSACSLAVEEAGSDGRLVVDRYSYSSVVQYGWSAGLGAETAMALLAQFSPLVPTPERTILLTADRGVRLRRLDYRAEAGFGDRSIEFESYWRACAARLARLAPLGSVIEIDSSDDDAEALEDRLVDLVADLVCQA
jgi:UMP-CMP kinase 2